MKNWCSLQRIFIYLIASAPVLILVEFYYSNTSFFYYVIQRATDRHGKIAPQLTREAGSKANISGKDTPEYIVDTPTCKIPATKIFPAYFTSDWEFWKNKTVPDCSAEMQLFVSLENDEVIYLTYAELLNCTILEILADPKDDNNFITRNRGKFSDRRYSVKDMEAFVVECDGKYHFGVTLPETPLVRRKITYWRDQAGKPVNVLIIGLDTTSRSHVYRSLPKTLKILDEMGFSDFLGFHTLKPSTLPNFYALLMGLREKEVDGGCQPRWVNTYDRCPMIWKTFNRHNYITMYHEDWLQSFNWYGGGGFTPRPVDYYAHPIFLALLKFRENTTFATRECASSEPLPDFMFRYTERFLRKFMHSPFFAMTHIAMPVHESEKALPSMDGALERLLLFLKAYPEIYENTLIILFGDHGIRYGPYMSEGGFEAFIERSMVPLFLRVPEKIMRTNPSFQDHLKHNTKMLTTAFDLHQTILHMLALCGLGDSNGTHRDFAVAARDRSSLLSPIPTNRTCETVHIYKDACVCNSIADVSPMENPYFIHKMIEYSMELLNEVVEKSRFKEKCETWEKSAPPLASAISLQNGTDFSHVLFKFMADPGKAEFEIQLKLKFDGTEVIGMEKMSNLTRINSYGNSSHCIVPHSQEDKLMQNFCYCKRGAAEEPVANLITTIPATQHPASTKTVQTGSPFSKQ